VVGSLGGRVQTIEKPSRWVYLVPIIHLSACAISFIGYLIPSLQFFGIVWVFIVLVDLPVSAIFYALAWKYSLIASLWVVVVGTLWWYLLSRGAEILVNKFKTPNSPG